MFLWFPFAASTSHFTQVIWKGTSELGCYNRKCGGGQYLMCGYKASGNIVGDNGKYFSENVQI
ncbi:hypothetical protein TWF481_002991 [Arthrobotrys musiformis]|uniref:SCP domain-containing protein n=1 Tax=Arthrobotrys musiformis TaxID=47236 RepID=A0AAV9VRV4_9PEZI